MPPMRVVAIAALVVAAVAQGNPKNGNVELVNNPSACAADLTGSVAAITGAANAIVKSVAACPPKTAAGTGQDTACAAGIVRTVTDLSLATQKLSSASMSCANTMATKKGGKCGMTIAAAIKGLSLSSGCLIASTESCKPPSEGGNAFGCVVDVVDVVDTLANAAHALNNAVTACGNVKVPEASHRYLYDTWLATGCPAVPSPDWIQWGYWYAETSDQDVLQAMFDWCASSKTGGAHEKTHAARLCCNSNSGSCDNTCNVQSQFIGTKTAPSDELADKEPREWARYLD